jgi:hypothetical protein
MKQHDSYIDKTLKVISEQLIIICDLIMGKSISLYNYFCF